MSYTVRFDTECAALRAAKGGFVIQAPKRWGINEISVQDNQFFIS